MATTEVQVYNPDKQRVDLLATYNPHDHLVSWTAYDSRLKRNATVLYYPAAWRLYELSLRYPNANFSSDIIHMNDERDFVIVRARLYLGASYEASDKKAEAYKQGKLSELDRVETKAKARAARDFGIGTEHALDMDDAEASSIVEKPETGRVVVEAVDERNPRQLPQPQKLEDIPTVSQLRERCEQLFPGKWDEVKKRVLKADIADGELTPDQCARIHGSLVAAEKQKAAKAGSNGAGASR